MSFSANNQHKSEPRDAQRLLHGCLTISFVLLVLSVAGSNVLAQSSRSKDKDAPNPVQLEIRVNKAEEGLLKEYMDVANEYYKQGAKEEAIEVLKRVEKINPKLDGLKQRMDLIGEELMQENDFKYEMDVAKGWNVPICEVVEGKAFRIAAAGDYKMVYSTTIPLTGLSTNDPAQDHVAAGPFGALIGVIVTDGKPGEPFAVNNTLEHTPKKSGQLYLRVNVPAAAKCTGDIKLQLSGFVKPLVKKR